jgi:Bacterial extracellular solute-binding proteins, family 5 Middle
VEHRGARTPGAREAVSGDTPGIPHRGCWSRGPCCRRLAGRCARPDAPSRRHPSRPAWDPPHFDHSLVHAYRTHVVISFTHSWLLRHRAGPGMKPGSLILQGDLAESWTQPNETTYVFKLRRGVRFHPKPPVNGRELTAEDVKYTFGRMLTETGSNASMYRSIAKVEVLDRYTVRFSSPSRSRGSSTWWRVRWPAGSWRGSAWRSSAISRSRRRSSAPARGCSRATARTSGSPWCATRATSWRACPTSSGWS